MRFLGKSSEPEVREIVRGAYQRFDVRSSVLLELARRPEPSDRVRFVDGLESSSLEVLSACLDALAGLPPGRDAAEQLALLQTVRRLGFDSREHALRSFWRSPGLQKHCFQLENFLICMFEILLHQNWHFWLHLPFF